MAALPNTGLETHPAGTGGLNSIISGNWERIDEIFDPTLGGADPAFNALMRSITKSTLTGLASGDFGVTWNGSSFILTKGFATLSYTATTDLPLGYADARTKLLSITGNLTLTTSLVKAGLRFEIIISADATLRTLTFPAGWKFVGAAAPANIAASKVGKLTLVCTTASDAGVIAQWEAQP